jgi:hypothetical protein
MWWVYEEDILVLGINIDQYSARFISQDLVITSSADQEISAEDFAMSIQKVSYNSYTSKIYPATILNRNKKIRSQDK